MSNLQSRRAPHHLRFLPEGTPRGDTGQYPLPISSVIKLRILTWGLGVTGWSARQEERRERQVAATEVQRQGPAYEEIPLNLSSYLLARTQLQ